jgi:hypothetical protein
MKTGTQDTGRDPSETLSDDDRAAINRMGLRMFDTWLAQGRNWEPVYLIRALNAGAAQVIAQRRKLNTPGAA